MIFQLLEKNEGLDGFGNWYKIQAQEEVKYTLDETSLEEEMEEM